MQQDRRFFLRGSALQALLCLLAAAMAFAARPASADAIWTVTGSSTDGAPLDSLFVGQQIVLEIGLTTTTPELYGISGSVNDYDRNVIQLNLAESTISDVVLCEFYNVMFGGCINGSTNLEPTIRVQDGVEGVGAEDTFLSILQTSPATGTGAVDEPFPQFRLVYDIVGLGATTLRIGTFADYADAYTIGSGLGVVNNTSVGITVMPEPTTALLLGLGLAGLSSTRNRE